MIQVSVYNLVLELIPLYLRGETNIGLHTLLYSTAHETLLISPLKSVTL